MSNKKLICVGIEATAHTFGVGIVTSDGKILANEKSSFTSEKGGIHPREAAQHHSVFWEFVLDRALEKANVSLNDIDLVSFSKGPGLGHCLRIGAVVGRSLATLLEKPIIGVNHCVGHVEIGKLTSGFKDPVTLYVSGANTQILAMASGRYRVFGETLDTGVGNFLDSFGRVLGLGFPAGPKIENLSLDGKNLIELPYSIKGMDFAFSGILTKLEKLSKENKYKKEDLCFSAQETVFAMLTEATERAVAHINKKEVLLTGGVAANKRLQDMIKTMCKDREVKFAVVPFSLAADNGAMIAWLGIIEFMAKGGDKILDTEVLQGWRTDDIDIVW
jgi:N6-L-threonylcarbamoyladenine synthase